MAINLKTIAQQAGVSESLVSQIERNRVSPAIDTLLTLADVLDINLEFLFEEYRKARPVHIVRKGERATAVEDDILYENLSESDKNVITRRCYREVDIDRLKANDNREELLRNLTAAHLGEVPLQNQRIYQKCLNQHTCHKKDNEFSIRNKNTQTICAYSCEYNTHNTKSKTRYNRNTSFKMRAII